MPERNGLLPGEFLVQLTRSTKVVLSDNKPESSHCLIVDTPAAAEIIRAIAESVTFDANGREKNELQALAIRIASRYSGH